MTAGTSATPVKAWSTRPEGRPLSAGDSHSELSAGSRGEYNYAGGELTTGELFVGDAGYGVFTHGMGTVNTSSIYVGLKNSGQNTYNLNGGTCNVSNLVLLGHSHSGYGQWKQTGGTLNSRSVFVGYSGSGLYDQTGGDHVASHTLSIAVNPGSAGIYQMSGNATLHTQWTSVGTRDGGAFSQSGSAAHTVDEVLSLGAINGGNGTYRLYGGTLSAATEYIGQAGAGQFYQSGGTNEAQAVTIALEATGVGTYTIYSGVLDVRDGTITVGGSGSGTLNVNGGVVIANTLHRGADSTVGGGPSGKLRVNRLTGLGSSPSFNCDVQIGHTGGDGLGAYNSEANTLLHLGDDLVVGYDARGELDLSASGADVVAEGDLYVGYQSGSSGGCTLASVSADLTATNQYIGWKSLESNGETHAWVTHSAGDNTVENSLYLGYHADSGGAYFLSGDSLATLTADYETVGMYGYGIFQQSGGVNRVSHTMIIGAAAGSRGIYTFTGGTLEATDLYVGWAGEGELYLHGNANLQAETLHVMAGGTVTDDGEHNIYRNLVVDGGTLDLGTADLVVNGSAAPDTMTVEAGTVTAGTMRVGVYQDGVFTVNGGNVHLTGSLLVGRYDGSQGDCEMTDGVLNVESDGEIGSRGTGVFDQSGGNVAYWQDLYLGRNGGDGTYRLDGGALHVLGTLYVGYEGTGTFIQTGGDLQTGRTVVAQGSTMQLAQDFHIDDQFNLDASTLNIGLYQLVLDGVDAQATIGSGAVLATGDQTIANARKALMIQTGGTNSVSGLLRIGFGEGSQGEYRLGGAGTLTAEAVQVGVNGQGRLDQTGGTHNVAGDMAIGVSGSGWYGISGNDSGVSVGRTLTIGGNGKLEMSGGTLSAETVEDGAGGEFKFYGGRLKAKAFVGDLNNAFNGTVCPGSSPGRLTVSGDYTQGASAARWRSSWAG